MADDLDKLIRDTEEHLTSENKKREEKILANESRGSLPKVSSAFIIWIIAILLAAFQFDNVISIVFKPADEKIEKDLTTILTTAADSLRTYQNQNGRLPPILPNPSIRGLVKYEQRSDFSFLLRATIADVTLVLESDKAHPYREARKK